MKVLKRKKATVELFVLFLLFPILLILMLNHITISETLASMDSGAFGKAYTYLSLSSGDKKFQKAINEAKNLKSSVAVTADRKKDGYTVRAIYFNKKYVNLPMKGGRFFREEDFKEDRYVAVLGKRLEFITYTKDGKRYLDLEGKEFEVLGILGYEEDTLLDDYIFVNGCISDEIMETSICVLDYLKKTDYEAVRDKMVSGLEGRGVHTEELTGGENFFESVVPSFMYGRKFIMMFLALILCAVLLSSDWLQSQKEEIYVRRLLGADDRSIILLFLKRFGILFLLTFTGAILYCGVFYPSYWNYLMAGYLAATIVLLPFLLFSMIGLLKTPLEEALKG